MRLTRGESDPPASHAPGKKIDAHHRCVAPNGPGVNPEPRRLKSTRKSPPRPCFSGRPVHVQRKPKRAVTDVILSDRGSVPEQMMARLEVPNGAIGPGTRGVGRDEHRTPRTTDGARRTKNVPLDEATENGPQLAVGAGGKRQSHLAPTQRYSVRDSCLSKKQNTILPAKQVFSSEREEVKETLRGDSARSTSGPKSNLRPEICHILKDPEHGARTTTLSAMIDGGRAVSRSLSGAAMSLCQVVWGAQAIGTSSPLPTVGVDTRSGGGKKGTGRNVMGY
ncbi:hypothetical protein EDB85DRAFT_2223272 [Lactarius pseudohatsudake]|nr:hypothetical protein EDB85DRAFT_2223272 [Lactarius pseudohatsudake]